MSAELVAKMRERVEKCRRLAKYINDPQASATLLQMADEGEADINKLLAEIRIEPPRQS